MYTVTKWKKICSENQVSTQGAFVAVIETRGARYVVRYYTRQQFEDDGEPLAGFFGWQEGETKVRASRELRDLHLRRWFPVCAQIVSRKCIKINQAILRGDIDEAIGLYREAWDRIDRCVMPDALFQVLDSQVIGNGVAFREISHV